MQNRYARITEAGRTIDARTGPGAVRSGIGYAAAMSFSREDLALLDEAQEVDIETRSAGGEAHRATIWIVIDGGVPYVRSYRGPNGRWYREIVANPTGAIHVDGRALAVTAVPATDAGSVARASAGFERKYATDPATPAMLRPETLDTTLRLEPA